MAFHHKIPLGLVFLTFTKQRKGKAFGKITACWKQTKDLLALKYSTLLLDHNIHEQNIQLK
jgi:hypothetical protein